MGISRHDSAGFALGALLLALTLTGCSSEPQREVGGISTPAPRTSSPADICITLISYWAKESLKGSKWAGLDWEQKGLSNEQYEIHEDLLAAAHVTESLQGHKAAVELIDARASQECTARRGATGSSENWRPPR